MKTEPCRPCHSWCISDSVRLRRSCYSAQADDGYRRHRVLTGEAEVFIRLTDTYALEVQMTTQQQLWRDEAFPVAFERYVLRNITASQSRLTLFATAMLESSARDDGGEDDYARLRYTLTNAWVFRIKPRKKRRMNLQGIWSQ